MDDRNPLTPAPETVRWYKRFWIIIRNVIKNCTVEPVGFLFFSAIIIQGVVIQNLYLKKVCLVNFHLNETECSAHQQNSTGNMLFDHPSDIQRYVSDLNIYASLLENLPNIMFVLFLGPWSDRNGRKLPMMIPIAGVLLSVVLYMVNDFFEHWPAEYLLFASIPLGLCGGSATMFMSLNSYIADITTSESRTSRISFLYGSIAISFPFANFVSIYIYTYGGYYAIWGTSFGLATLTLLYIAFFITDSRGPNSLNASEANREENELLSENASPNFSCLKIITNLWECFEVTFQKRLGYKRSCLCLLMFSMTIYVLATVPTNVSYLYTKMLFGWDQPQYSLFSTVTSITAVLGSFVLLPLLSSRFKLDDCFIGIVSIIMNVAGLIGIAFSRSLLSLYLAAVIAYILTSGIGVILRSSISKLVLSDELSHVYAVLASFESIVPLISSPLFNLVYKASLDSFAGCIYILAGGLMLIVFILLSTVMFLQRKDRNAQVLYLPVDEIPENEDSTIRA